MTICDDRAVKALAAAAAMEGQRIRKLADDIDGTRSWYIVHTTARQEAIAKRHLEGAGYRIYTPMMRSLIKPRANELSRAQRKIRHLLAKEKIAPIFPRYHFVRINLEADPWHDIFRTFGVSGMFVNGNIPARCPDALIEGLRDREVNGYIPGDTPIEELPFKVGDRARAIDGAFIGFRGAIERIDPNGRITLLLDMFGRSTPVAYNADEIEPIG